MWMKSRSRRPIENNEPVYEFGAFRLEADGTLWRADVPVHLTPKELAALRVLLSSPGQVVTASHLKESLWGDVHVTADSVPRCLSSLRARLGGNGYIQTVYKRGYRLDIDVRRIETMHPHSTPRLAIVPFSCGYGVEPHLGYALSEETAARLTRSHSPLVSVLARDSVFALAANGTTAQRIGEILRADLVLTGNLNAWNHQFRLRAEMIRVCDGTQIWVEDLLIPRGHPGTLERVLLERLALRLGGTTSQWPAADSQSIDDSADAHAYDLYLRGHCSWQSLESHRMDDGAQLLRRAREVNPALREARVDLVRVTTMQSLCGFISPQEAAEVVRQEASSIPNVAETAPNVLLALGWLTFHVDRDLRTALRFYAASAHVPHDAWTTCVRALMALSRHRFNEAVELLQTALHSDPFSPWMHTWMAWALHLAGRTLESRQRVEHCLKLYPGHESTRWYGALILAFQGETALALQLARELRHQNPEFDIAASIEAYALAVAGKRKEAREVLERLEWLSRERFVLTSFTPAAYIALGDEERAIAELRSSEASCCPWFFQMLADPRLNRLQGHPEFERMRSTLRAMEPHPKDSPDHGHTSWSNLEHA